MYRFDFFFNSEHLLKIIDLCIDYSLINTDGVQQVRVHICDW